MSFLRLWRRCLAARRLIDPSPGRLAGALMLAALCGVLAGCPGPAAPPPDNSGPGSNSTVENAFVPPPVAFVDIAGKLGIDTPLAAWPHPSKIIEAFGSGSGFFDFDADGWLDVLVIDRPSVRLYRSVRGERLEDVTERAGLNLLDGWWYGCTAGDYDSDGFIDLVLTGYRRLALLRNQGGDEFVDVTHQAGLDGSNLGKWASSAALMDLDNDGWLDLTVLNYAIFGPDEPQHCGADEGIASCPPLTYKPIHGHIFRNPGHGEFALVPAEYGMRQSNGPSLVLAFTDLEFDGLLDFYVGNDGLYADLLRNAGQMRFENEGIRAGVASNRESAMAAMGADFGDYNRDGLLDLIVTDFSERPYAVFRYQGDGIFDAVGDELGISGPTRLPLGFGEHWIDVDNDSWLDIAFMNGHVYETVSHNNPGQLFRQPMMLFYNQRGESFVDLVPALGGDLARHIVGRGSSRGDFDRDGLEDMLVVDYEGPPMLLHNRTTTSHHWINVRLLSASGNRYGYGARVEGRVGESEIWIKHATPVSSYLSCSEPTVHFGLGEHAVIERLTIHWPSGHVDELTNVEADREVTILEGQGVVHERRPIARPSPHGTKHDGDLTSADGTGNSPGPAGDRRVTGRRD